MLGLTPPHAGFLLGFAEIEIEAPAARVWSVLTDFASYGSWNPFTPELKAELRVGAPVEILALFGPLRFRERGEVIGLEPGALLRWYVYPMPAVLARGDRVQRVEPLGPGRCRFSSEDRLTGAMAPLIVAASRAGVNKGFRAMAQALKRVAEEER